MTKDREFYKQFFALYWVLVLHNIIILGVNLADNIMIGSYSETALAGVAGVNQIQFIFNQIILGSGNALVILGSQYSLRSALIDAVLCRIDAEEFNRRIMSLKENYPEPAYYSTLNMISSHDVERIVTLMSGAPTRHEVDRHYQASFTLSDESRELAIKRTQLIYGMVMTMPGVPCIFYGDELGVQGYGDPFCRSCFPWDNMDGVDPNGKMRNYIKQLIALRKSSTAFSTGEMECAYCIGNTYCYVRSYNDEKYLVVANFDGSRHDIRLDVARFGITELNAVMYEGDIRTHHKSDAGMFFVDALPVSVAVYKCS